MAEGDKLEVCDGKGLIVEAVLGSADNARHAPVAATADVRRASF